MIRKKAKKFNYLRRWLLAILSLSIAILVTTHTDTKASILCVGVISGIFVDGLIGPYLFFEKDYECTLCKSFITKLVNLNTDVAKKCLSKAARYSGGDPSLFVQNDIKDQVLFNTDFAETERRLMATMNLAQVDGCEGDSDVYNRPQKNSTKTTGSGKT